MYTKTMTRTEPHTEIFLLINLCNTILGQDLLVQFIDRKQNKISLFGRMLRAHYYVNVAYRVFISAYQAYIQDVTRGTSRPLKILDHQIGHFESI